MKSADAPYPHWINHSATRLPRPEPEERERTAIGKRHRISEQSLALGRECGVYSKPSAGVLDGGVLRTRRMPERRKAPPATRCPARVPCGLGSRQGRREGANASAHVVLGCDGANGFTRDAVDVQLVGSERSPPARCVRVLRPADRFHGSTL